MDDVIYNDASILNKGLLNFDYKLSTYNAKSNFQLHYHPYSEIYIYLRGRVEFIVDSLTYELSPFDVLIIPPYKLHRPKPETHSTFERIVINVYPEFYKKLDCEQYKEFYKKDSIDNLKISSKVIKRTKFYDIINEIKTYTDNYQNIFQPITYFKVGELLHVLNSISSFESFNIKSDIILKVLEYIDSNYNNISSLSDLTSKFNYSKNHLCYIFKKHTGFTIHKYINIKRFENVKKLCAAGESITMACIESGFESYGSFSYAYKKEFGHCPKIDLK